MDVDPLLDMGTGDFGMDWGMNPDFEFAADAPAPVPDNSLGELHVNLPIIPHTQKDPNLNTLVTCFVIKPSHF